METPDTSTRRPFLRRLGFFLAILTGVGLVELWALSSLYGADRFAGPMIGAAVALGLCGLPLLGANAKGNWEAAWIAGASSVLELILGLAAIMSISAVAVMVAPEPFLTRLSESKWSNEVSVLLIIGLSILVSARGWMRYRSQRHQLQEAALREEKARTRIAEQEGELARTELTVLKAQIEPHFLWNTLAHVQHLTKRSPVEAEAMIGHLIRFLRTSIPNSRSNRTTLGEEIDSANAYLELMRMRMGSRLAVVIEVDPKVADLSFPSMLIQTLVENAIKHGVEPKVGNATIAVTACAAEGICVVRVTDDGVGLMSSPASAGTGMGLRNVRDRLRMIYGSKAHLSIISRAGGGLTAEITVPLGNHEEDQRLTARK